MKQQRTSVLLCLFVFSSVLFACERQDHRPASVLFEGTYTTTNEVLNPPPMLQQKSTGAGKSTDLDITKFVAIASINTSTAPPFNVSGTGTFSADNGDIFYTTFSGTSTPNADGTSTVSVTHTLTTGGTGKFTNATGTFIGNTIANPRNPTGSITYKGTITL